MKLVSPHVKALPQSEVKPFIVTVQPIAGESLLGYVNRALSNTPIRRTVVGLSLAGIGTLRPESMPASLTDQAQVEGLATLLGVDSSEITSRLLRKTVGPNSLEAFDFFKLPIRQRLREYRFRRVAARALAVSNHYRALWDIAVFRSIPKRSSLSGTVALNAVANSIGFVATGSANATTASTNVGSPRSTFGIFPRTPS